MLIDSTVTYKIPADRVDDLVELLRTVEPQSVEEVDRIIESFATGDAKRWNLTLQSEASALRCAERLSLLMPRTGMDASWSDSLDSLGERDV